MKNDYDVIIVGGGITGTSLLYTLANYTDMDRILLIEKYGDFATLNSNSKNNAQTLHFGDIETNYALGESKRIKEEAQRVLRYFSGKEPSARKGVIEKCQKMVLAVGEDEMASIEKTYDSGLKSLFPGLRVIGRGEIGRTEPNIVKGRKKEEKIAALLSDTGYMVDFGKLTHMFASDARKVKGKKIDILFNTKVSKMEKAGDSYRVFTNKKSYSAGFVSFATGSYSLYFAKSIGIDKNLSILSIGGGFYTSKKVLRGKVYRVQKGGIPFAAVHGDPDITNPKITRFGPTVTVPPMLEKRHLGTVIDYMKTFDFDLPTFISLEKILFNRDIRRIVARNIAYGIPGVGKYEFLKNEAAKIVPGLKYADIRMAGDIGGIRPQIIDENKHSLVLGAGKITHGGVIFTITPSPGASSCLANALKDTLYIADYLDRKFDREKYGEALGEVTEAALSF